VNAAYDYIRDGAEIYKNSFAIIRREADLRRFSPEEERVAVRVIHASGMVEITPDLYFSPGAAQAGIAALAAGAPILCDANMVAHGVTRARLPANNEVICTLADPRVAELAKEHGHDAHGGGDGVLEAASRRRGGRLRQCADGAVSSVGNA
jgi:precorrin-8X/cobalt-precorrin-8 methylmutase